jgi:peptidoglycan hydrolase CwlO-like protein
MTDPKDLKIAALEQQVKHLNSAVGDLTRKIELLSRENNRRKNEISQIESTVKKI